MSGVANFAMKFKKNKASRESLTEEGLAAIVEQTKQMTNDLIADCRVCKAHLPRKVEGK